MPIQSDPKPVVIRSKISDRFGSNQRDPTQSADQWSQEIWGYLFDGLRLSQRGFSTLDECLSSFWSRDNEDFRALPGELTDTVSVVVCWKLWTSYCRKVFGGEQESLDRVQFRVRKLVWELFVVHPPKCSSGAHFLIGSIYPARHIGKKRWRRWYNGNGPQHAQYKLNVDISSPGNLGPAGTGAGAVLRTIA